MMIHTLVGGRLDPLEFQQNQQNGLNFLPVIMSSSNVCILVTY